MSNMDYLKIEKSNKYNECEFNNEYVRFYPNNSLLVTYNNVVIGFFTIQKFFDNSICLEYALSNNYKKRGIGQKFLHIITEYVFEKNPNFEKMVLLIYYDNKASQIIATREKFTIDYELMENISNEINNYIPYVKNNPYYKNNLLKKSI